MEQKEKIQELLHKYANNHIGKDEFHELLGYLSSPDLDRELVKWMKAAMQGDNNKGEENSKVVDEIVARLDESVFKAIDSSVKTVPPVTVVKRIPVRRRMLVAASMILLLGSVALLWFFQQQSPVKNPVIAAVTHDVQPGKNQAYLKVGNNQGILLDSNQSAVIAKGKEIRYGSGELVTAVEESGTAQVTNHEIVQVTLSTPPGGQYKLTLPDGSRVWLNAASEIRYPMHFAGKNRKVELTGEAYFEVEKDVTKPFIVTSDGQDVTVLGTKFNVSAYTNDQETMTTLVEGSVKVTPEQKAAKLIEPGQQALLRKDQNITVRKVNTSYYTSWKDGLFVFNRLPVSAIFPQVERWYDVKFNYPAQLNDVPMWGTVKRNVMLSEILEVLSVNTGLKFSLEGGNVFVTSGNR